MSIKSKLAALEKAAGKKTAANAWAEEEAGRRAHLASVDYGAVARAITAAADDQPDARACTTVDAERFDPEKGRRFGDGLNEPDRQAFLDCLPYAKVFAGFADGSLDARSPTDAIREGYDG